MRMTETRPSQKIKMKSRTAQPGKEEKLEDNPKNSRKKEKRASKTSES